jgi:hypothetical protein
MTMTMIMIMGFSIQHTNSFKPETFLFGRLSVPYVMDFAVTLHVFVCSLQLPLFPLIRQRSLAQYCLHFGLSRYISGWTREG